MPKKQVDLLQGTLDLIVLNMLRAGPANGWELTQSIEVTSQGAFDVNTDRFIRPSAGWKHRAG